MSYLLDKKKQKKKIWKALALFFFLFLVIYFRADIIKGLSGAVHFVFRPFVVVGNGIGGQINSFASFFASKKMLSLENETLKMKLLEKDAEIAGYLPLAEENSKMKEILNRKKTQKDLILSGILLKPNSSPYDTLVIDAGLKDGVVAGAKVLAFGDIPVGYVAEVYADSAKVIFFSNPGEKTEVVIPGKDVFMQIVGRGGGNFEMILPRDFVLEENTEVILPGTIPSVVAKVSAIISDPRDSYQKALLVSPVNIFELRFVEVEK